MKYSIIIPNYNGAHFLKDCLNSLDLSQEIIIIDNNSKDNSRSVIASIAKQSHLKIIQNSINMGFAGAVNQGIKAATNDYVVLANNDLVLEKNWFKLIDREVKKHPDVACFCGTVLTRDGSKYEGIGLKFNYNGSCKNIKNGEPYTPHDQKPYFIWGSSAALVVYKKSILEKIGYFDENFFAYEEDVDLALRLHNQNYKTLLIPNAICYHLGGGTSGKMGNFRHKMDFKNWIFLIIKNYSTKEILLNLFPIIEQRLRNFSGLIKNTPKGQKLSSISWVFQELKKNIPKMLKYSHDYRN